MRDDLHTLAGAYALDALPEDARRLFEGHLGRCTDCAAEVRELQATAARLGAAVAEQPPAGMRVAVLSRIGEVRQVAPISAREPERGDRPTAVSMWLARGGRWRLRVTAGLTAAVVAASLMIAFVQGMEADRAGQRLRRAEAASRAVAAVLSAPDAHTFAQPVSGGGMAAVVMSHSRGQMVFASHGLGRLSPARTYQLWMIGPAGAKPAGLLRPDASGRTAPMVAGGMGDTDRIGLTIEPAAGSARPTTNPVVVLRVA
jgi:anti-sigma-K factor RskA